MKKYLLVLLVSLIFVLSVNVEGKPTENKFYETQWRSIEKYNKMIDSFERKYGDFPVGYSGAYIGEDGKLNVKLLRSEMKELKTTIKNENIDDITFLEGEVSFLELRRLQKEIAELDEFISAINVQILSVYKDVIKQKVIVEVSGNLDRTHKMFSKFVDVGLIEVVISEYERPTANINAGNGISSYGAGGGSIGFAATVNGKDGIITAGHVATETEKFYIEGSDGLYRSYGYTEDSYLQVNADFAFIESFSNDDLTRYTKNGYYIEFATTGSLPQNTTVDILGDISGIVTTTVLDSTATVYVSYYAPVGTIKHTNVVKYDDPVSPGDSGGGVFVEFTSNSYILTAIMISTSTHTSTGNKFVDIYNELNMTLYG